MTRTVVTLGINSALQILKGSHDEGMQTLCVCLARHVDMYRRYPCIDRLEPVADYSELASLCATFNPDTHCIVPHSSFLSRLGSAGIMALPLPYFGSRAAAAWEERREQQRYWMAQARLNLPRVFQHIDEIDSPVVVKAGGGMRGDNFFARNQREFERRLRDFRAQRYVIQEYIIGVPIMLHYFASPLSGQIESLAADRRYETNVDSLGRIPTENQAGLQIEPSFVRVGNLPVAIRESLLSEVYRMGEALVAVSRDLFPPRGLFGPFSLEAIITPSQQFYALDLSTSIVGGTNLFINGSPYAALFYDEPMSMGRRCSREIRLAAEAGRLPEVFSLPPGVIEQAMVLASGG
ncbi:MAG: formate--phosphoribosylaminoimidazolecarboxamide ligase [Dehalococcoidia bacterium]